MGCHTWFYTKSKNQYDYETAQKYVIESYEREIALLKRYLTDSLTKDEIEYGCFNIQDNKENVFNTLQIYERKLRLVSNGFCKVATMTRFSVTGCKEYFISRTKQFYVETKYHDIFRVSNYPNNVLLSLEETLKFIDAHEIRYIHNDYLDRLKQFWLEYPEGVIVFG